MQAPWQAQSPDLAQWFSSPVASQHARTFAVRIVSLDYHYAKPLPGLDPTSIPRSGVPIPKVCVLRVFGSTPSGQKTCLHVHQVLSNTGSVSLGAKHNYISQLTAHTHEVCSLNYYCGICATFSTLCEGPTAQQSSSAGTKSWQPNWSQISMIAY